MTNNPETALWHQFDLAERNQDPGGGILYAIRYDSAALYSHRDNVVNILTEHGVSIYVNQDGVLTIDLTKSAEDAEERLEVLIEELTVVNDAIELHEMGLNPGSIMGMSNSLKNSFYQAIDSTNPDDRIDALNLVDLGIPQIVHDLEVAHVQNQVLSDSDEQTVKALGEFASYKSDLHGGHRVIVMGDPSLN